MNLTALQKFLDGYVASGRAAGVDCIVCQDHEQIFRHFTGMRDPDENSPMKGDEIYVAFSMTKMVTCTAALQLYEQGAYRLEDPVAKYLPEFGRVTLAGGGAPQKPITVWHLFTMGAGLNYDRETPGIRAALAAGKTTTRDLVGAMALRPLDFEPGSHFQYSLCHDVLGALIEVWSGKRLVDFRFHGRIKLHQQIPESLFGEQIVKLTLQPLIENAVQHGLSHVRDGGEIWLRGEKKGQNVSLYVIDNGDKLSPEDLERLRGYLADMNIADGKHIGMRNVDQRLKLVFGEEYGLSVGPSEEGGLCVEIRTMSV